MTGKLRFTVLCAVLAAFTSVTAMAQYPSELVSFEDGSFGDPADQEMFWEPEHASASTNYVVHNSAPGAYDRNAAFRDEDVNFATDGSKALTVQWKWASQFDPDSWVRFYTYNHAVRPNPSLDTRGKVRFDLTNFGDFNGGEIGVCLGIRETGIDVPQLDNGGSTGTIEWVGVDPTINAIIAGTNGIAETTAANDDVQVVPVNSTGLETQTVVILPGPNGQIDSIPTGDDQTRYGYFLSTNGVRIPIPAVTMPVSFFAASVEFDLATGNVTVDGVPTTGAIVAFTGNNVLDPPNFRGTLDHLAITNVTTDPPTSTDPQVSDVFFGLDAIQFEATVPDPVLPPTVVSPIIAGETSVTVTDLSPTVNRIRLLKNGSEIDFADVADNSDYSFTIASAVTGDYYTATQRDGTTGTTSAESAPVYVFPEPSPYTFSILLDEAGTGSCLFDPPGWEWVGVTSVGSGSVDDFPRYWPAGQALFTDDAQWQVVDIPFDDPGLIIAGLGGNGALAPSPTGFYNIDSIWFTIADGATSNGLGPWEVFVDRIETIGTSGLPEPLMTMEDGVNRFSSSRGQALTPTTSSALSTTASYDGVASHRILWTYSQLRPEEAVGKLQRVGGCGTAEDIPDTTTTLRFHMLLRGQRTNLDAPLPVVTGPIVAGTQDTVRVTVNAAANWVQLYINGDSNGLPVVPTGTYVDFSGLTLTPGDSISAKQDVGTVGVSDFAYPKGVSAQPLPPVVQEPLLPGATEVTLTDVLITPFATATDVTVYENGFPVGSVSTTGFTSSTVVVPVTALSSLSIITATQTVNGEISEESAGVFVGVPAPVIYMAPAAGATSVRVTSLNAAATEASVTVNGSTTFSTPVTPGTETADIAVSGLVMGDVLIANQSVGLAPSADSDPEVVTTASVTSTIWCDDFEYADQAAFNANWPALATTLQLSTAQNTTNAGSKSMYAPDDTSTYRNTRGVLTGEKGTDTHPVVFSINIYDETAAIGVNQYADINNLTSDFFLAEIGMSNFGSDNESHYTARLNSNGGPNWFALDQFDGPVRSVGWHNFTMVFKGPPEGATLGHEIDVFVDGLLSAKNVTLTDDTTLREPRIGSGQATSAAAYYDDYCAEVGPVTFPVLPPPPPAAPTIRSPIEDGDASININLGDIAVTSLEVFANAASVGTFNYPAGTNGIVTVTVPALVHLDAMHAESTNASATTAGPVLEVGAGNGDILVCVAIKEDSDGGIWWIGADVTSTGAPQGLPISPSAGWQTLTFDPVSGPVLKFIGGDGVISGTTGTLEHLAVAVNSASTDRSTGAYTVYIDNVVNVGAGAGGSDLLITDFEGFALGSEVLFQEPTFSGSTYPSDLSYPPAGSEVTDAYANGGTQSALLTWFWKDTTEERWARITTSNALNLPAPAIDITKPIRLDVLLLPSGLPPCPAADVNCDGVANGVDMGIIKQGANWNQSSPGNPRADVNGDGVANGVDMGIIKQGANWNVSFAPCACP